jgi:hypothetical protein
MRIGKRSSALVVQVSKALTVLQSVHATTSSQEASSSVVVLPGLTLLRYAPLIKQVDGLCVFHLPRF